MTSPLSSAFILRLALATGLASTAACAGNGAVDRVMDGHLVRGRRVPEQAYAFFLAGSLAEARGETSDTPASAHDLRAAVWYYEGAARADGRDPSPWTRAGRLRCRLDPADANADKELGQALSLDAAYAPALAAQAFCAKVRSGGTAAATALAEATDGDDLATQPVLMESDSRMERVDVGTHRQVVALTLLHPGRVAAWDALASWGIAHGDATLTARGLVGVARLAPKQRLAVAAQAVALEGEGHLAAAREVAAALLDAPGDRTSGGEAKGPASVPELVRLALDAAILAKDTARLRARMERAHFGSEAAAGRALALGDPSLARALVALPAKAEPRNAALRLAHEAAEGRAASYLLPSAAAHEGTTPPDRLPVDLALPIARMVLASEGAAAAHRVLAAADPVPPGDPVLTPLAVDLAVAGALGDDALPPDARIELAARRGSLPAEADVADKTLDARHRLLGLVLLHPADPGTAAEAKRLASSADEDPLVAVALARLHLAKGLALEAAARARLESAAAADPLVAAALVDLVKTDGPAAALPPARHRLAVLARTPAERAGGAD